MPTNSKAAVPAVNLDNLDIDAKPASRPASAVVATVNGIAIKKGDADKFLALASKGRATDLDKLPKKQRDGLLKGYAVSVLIEDKASKEVPMKVKNKLAASYWAKQEMSKIDVSDKEAKAFYEKNKKMYKDKSGKLLAYDKVSQYIKVQLKQKKFNEKLIKNAKIVIK
ncbi:Cell binding factor 2 precursor [hydrothermal vent metagenome]|uniref:Cell binding factor 2 n=1 Tax=hydrothermal vent metagenome TaxID=652676 RepID=A0A1W1B8F0_9ZZZZ